MVIRSRIDEDAHPSDHQHEVQFHDRRADTEDKSVNILSKDGIVNQIDTEVDASDQQRSDDQTQCPQGNSENVPRRSARWVIYCGY